MRGVLVGVLGFIGVVALGFGVLFAIAEGIEPAQEEVRVELDDNFPR
jgi:hypothetical protein